MKEQIQERYTLSIERIKEIETEKTVGEKFQDFFAKVSGFLLEIDRVNQLLENDAWKDLSFEEMQSKNRKLY